MKEVETNPRVKLGSFDTENSSNSRNVDVINDSLIECILGPEKERIF
jgi:hypothetical protein